MPLLDHFHPPVSKDCQWGSAHSTWATTMLQRLNGTVLSRRFVARTKVHFGNEIEIDLAAEENVTNGPAQSNGAADHGGVATLTRTYAPPRPAVSEVVAFVATDAFEVQVYLRGSGWKLVAAVEIVSPANKDRPSSRRAFVRKCASLLQSGVSVVVLDVVTELSANLHVELVGHLHLPDAYEWASPTGLSAVSYRTVQGVLKPEYPVGDERVRLDMWPHALTVGTELPTVPLWLAGDLAVPLELEHTYLAACDALRIG